MLNNTCTMDMEYVSILNNASIISMEYVSMPCIASVIGIDYGIRMMHANRYSMLACSGGNLWSVMHKYEILLFNSVKTATSLF